MALMIASTYRYLCSAQARDGLTAFQILVAHYPTAFKSRAQRGFLKELIYSVVSTDQQRARGNEASGTIQKVLSFITNSGCKGESYCICPMIEDIREEKRRHEVVSELAKIFAQDGTSWKNTYEPAADVKSIISESGGGNPSNKPLQVGRKNKALEGESDGIGELESRHKESMDSFHDQEDYKIESCEKSLGTSKIPLFLAAKEGCVEVIEAILDVYPQALEYLNECGETALHVAVKNRHSKEMIQLLLRKCLPLKCLIRVIDHNGNSILHVAGSQRERVVDAKLKSPVIQLKEDLCLLEELKTLCPRFLINARNKKKTADELFALNNEGLRNEAKEWLKRTAEHCTVVTVLIATVAFAAAYTVPGGPNQVTGVPLLVSKPFFLIFTAADVLSLAFALAAVVIFLSILTSPFQLKNFRRSLPEKLLLGMTLLFLSVSMMMLSFAATVILTINKRERWTKIAIYSVAFFPVSIFVLSYIPLYVELTESFKYWIKRITRSLPRCAAKPSSRENIYTPPSADIV